MSTKASAAPKPSVIRKILPAMINVMTQLSKDGVAKTSYNENQKYNFRGIDDVMNALSPLLSENKILVTPRCVSREQSQRAGQNGGSLTCVVVEAEFDFISAVDESQITVKMFGEAMDSADKATNKAMSAAYKYACIQAFCIPTEGDNDADASSPDVVTGIDLDTHVAATREQLATCATLTAVDSLWTQATAILKKSDHRLLTTYFEKRRAELDPGKNAALNEPATESAIRVLSAKVKAAGLTEDDIKKQFNFGFEGMSKANHNAVTAWLKTRGA